MSTFRHWCYRNEPKIAKYTAAFIIALVLTAIVFGGIWSMTTYTPELNAVYFP